MQISGDIVMKLTVNGEQEKTEVETLQKLLQSFDIKHSEKGVAVAVNSTVIAREQWQNYQLNDGDKVEIIRATQGG